MRASFVTWIQGVVLAQLTMVVACKDKPRTPSLPVAGADQPAPRNAEIDRLLALAPDGTALAIAASPRALELAEATIARVRSIGAADPTLGPSLDEVERELARGLGRATLPGRAELGLADDRGLVWFELADGASASIWPVEDHRGFVAAFAGEAGADGIDTVTIAGRQLRCRAVAAGHACASELAILDRLGRGSLAGQPARVGARGDLEVVGIADGGRFTAAVTVALDPGRATVRARFGPMPAALRPLAQRSVRVDASHAAGFVGLVLPRTALATVADATGLGPLADALDGEITAVTPAGGGDVEVRVPFHDATVARQLLDGCAQFSAPPKLRVARAGDGCRISATGLGQLPDVEADVWLDGTTLRLRRARAISTPATGAAPTTTGQELAGGAWHATFWGRGTMLGAWAAAAAGVQSQAAMLRLTMYVVELGGALGSEEDDATVRLVVRTLFDNPASVADAVPALVARAADGRDVRADLAALVVAHPDAPLAADLTAGDAGLRISAFAIGVVAAMVIPQFLDAMKTSKRSEADLNLDAIAKAAVASYAENAAFPIATAGPTPATPCCAAPMKRCPGDVGDWEGTAAWNQLDFAMTNPHLFQYSYRSTGQEFTATAEGDLDCDGQEDRGERWIVTGRVVGGQPVIDGPRREM